MSIEKIDINNLQQEKKDFSKMFDESFVDISVQLEHPPVAISFGTYTYKGKLYYIPFGSYGDFSCIVGASKSMKTFFKSALVAGYIGGRSNEFFPDIQGHDNKGKLILDIDTEQSLYHVQRVARRSMEMVGSVYDNYVPISLRPKAPQERFEFIEWLIMEKYRGRLGLVCIDGAADLTDDVNDLKKANEITNAMMKWTKEGNLHLVTVLHRNFGSSKPTGHLGSSVLKKAETVCFIEREDDRILVKPEYTRNYPFTEFAFDLDNDFLPRQIKNDFI